MTHNRFTEARDHLAAASLLIKKFNECVHVETDEPENSAETESEMYEKSHRKIFASVLIVEYWEKYVTKLLCSSEKRIWHDTRDKLYTLCNSKLLSVVCPEKK